MLKGRRLLSWAGILLLSGAASFYGIQAQGEKEPRQPAKTQAQGEKEPVPAAETGRPDLIKIVILAAFQKLELPRPPSPMTSIPRRLARKRRIAPPATSRPSPPPPSQAGFISAAVRGPQQEKSTTPTASAAI